MSKLKWTRADAKRASKMGWELEGQIATAANGHDYIAGYNIVAPCHGPLSPFKSDREAVKWVIETQTTFSGGSGLEFPEHVTCRKAILLCCGG
jgi:hypothetical protein